MDCLVILISLLKDLPSELSIWVERGLLKQFGIRPTYLNIGMAASKTPLGTDACFRARGINRLADSWSQIPKIEIGKVIIRLDLTGALSEFDMGPCLKHMLRAIFGGLPELPSQSCSSMTSMQRVWLGHNWYYLTVSLEDIHF